MEGILLYIADKAWRSGSKYKLKALEGRAGEGEKVGDVIEGENSTIYAVDTDNAYRFSGEVTILVDDVIGGKRVAVIMKLSLLISIFVMILANLMS